MLVGNDMNEIRQPDEVEQHPVLAFLILLLVFVAIFAVVVLLN